MEIRICGRWIEKGSCGAVVMPRALFAEMRREDFFLLALETEERGNSKVADELLELAVRWDIASRQVRAVA